MSKSVLIKKITPVTFHIISLFPEVVEPYVNSSILKRAQEKGMIALKYYNPRNFVVGKDGKIPKDLEVLTYSEKRVDNRPYGGGPGMVIEALPMIRAIDEAIGKKIKSIKTRSKVKIVFFSPAGEQFTNEIAETFKKYTDIVFVCGRYEGIDARVKKAFPMVDISVGPYVLTGGELPAMIMIDTIARRIPGVLGDHASVEENRIASPDVYTRPEVIEYKKKKYRVPKVLLSGNHAKMDEWRTAVRAGGVQKKPK
ncbi:MAG TPA: tRNA (guanosine(37)-N1)-methyltransferase TrmD [Candidatus Paceibacterota bacterium]|jgi:tRNA (guanine37-N1)-methyltransferase|nr:tRNA (guanosine(37)-N1)-methyltransferase TrmD [Candidatus Paceibacterota bacterium]